MGALDFLDECTNEELAPLVKFIVDEGSETEMLTVDEGYQKYKPDHHKYLEKIKNEILDFGSNTFWFQTDYKTIVEDVWDKLDSDLGNVSIWDMEAGIMAVVFTNAWKDLSAEDRRAVLQSLDEKETLSDYSGKITTAALTALFRQGGFASYQLAVIVANSIAKFALGRGLSFAANAALTKCLSVFAGPVGWAITAAWTLIDFGGPAYRVTVPAVCYIASLRFVHEGEGRTNP